MTGIYRILFMLAVVFTAVVTAEAEPIDLTACDLYVRTGFSAQWINRLPDVSEGKWHRVPPGKNGARVVMVKNLPLTGIPQRPFFSPKRYPPMTFTMISSFKLDAQWLRPGRLPGINFAQISNNWEIYLNGTPVRREMYLDREGRITRSRGMRDVHFPLDPRLLKKGTNILALRIVGDPTFDDTGLGQSGPYIIDDYEKLLDLNSETIPLVLLFLYFFVGVYHIFLFLLKRDEKQNLLYGLFSSGLFVYLFMRTHTVYALLPDTEWVFRIELCCLFTLIPLICLFFDYIQDAGMSVFARGYGIFCGLLIIAVIPASVTFALDVLRIWQFTALVPITYYFAVRMIYRFYLQFRRYAENRGISGPLRGYLHAAVKTLTVTVEGNLLIGIGVLTATAVYDIVDAVYLHNDLVLTRYGFFVFVMGTTLVLANRFIYVHRQVGELNLTLEQKISDLDEANRIITVSEEKYRLLVEGSSDPIFSLDKDLGFITANRAMLREMKLNADELRGYRLNDLMYFEADEEAIGKSLVREKIDEFFQQRLPVNFRVKLRSPSGAEPRDFQIRLEHVAIEGKNEVLGKAISVADDTLLEFFRSERQHYSIKNYLIVSDEISRRMVRNLAGRLSPQQITMLRMGLREIIINSIEHGNLNITFDEKSRETMSENYLEFVARRQNDPRYRDRRVGIEYSINAERAIFKITDDGDGFDHGKMISEAAKIAGDGMLAHGRGIIMALSIFDEVRYNRKGNQVLLVKYLPAYGRLTGARTDRG